MEKINRFRQAQTLSYDDFINKVLKEATCKYCINHDECQEMMELDNIDDEFSIYGCSAFDNTIDSLTKIYLQECCIKTKTEE